MKRKYLIGIPLWNCLDMVPWILEGCAKLDASRVELVFLFSNTPSEVLASYERSQHIIAGFSRILMATLEDVWEGGNHNLLMKYFMTTYRDILICPQDDHQWQSGRILDDLDAVFDRYGDRVGVIGGRDGYGYNYGGMVGARHSDSAGVGRWLAHGETAECLMVNPGPFVYSRHTVAQVGYNEDMPIFSFEDYCLRCNLAGKVNLCMGMDVVHKKFGRNREMRNGGPMVADDLRRLQLKWWPIIGNCIHG